MRDNLVLIVGAGYSKAISEHMPLMWELGAQISGRPGVSIGNELAETPAADLVRRWIWHDFEQLGLTDAFGPRFRD